MFTNRLKACGRFSLFRGLLILTIAFLVHRGLSPQFLQITNHRISEDKFTEILYLTQHVALFRIGNSQMGNEYSIQEARYVQPPDYVWETGDSGSDLIRQVTALDQDGDNLLCSCALKSFDDKDRIEKFYYITDREKVSVKQFDRYDQLIDYAKTINPKGVYKLRPPSSF